MITGSYSCSYSNFWKVNKSTLQPGRDDNLRRESSQYECKLGHHMPLCHQIVSFTANILALMFEMFSENAVTTPDLTTSIKDIAANPVYSLHLYMYHSTVFPRFSTTTRRGFWEAIGIHLDLV